MSKNYIEREEFEKKLKDVNKSSFIKGLAMGLIIAVVSTILGLGGQYLLSERHAEITTAYEFDPLTQSVNFTLHNDAKVSTSEIRIIGKVNGQERNLKTIRDKVLSDKEDLEVQIPYDSVNTTLEIKEVSTPDFTLVEFNRGELFKKSELLYRIECDKCRNDDSWKLVSPKNITYSMEMHNLYGQLYSEVIAPSLEWRTK